MYGLRFKLRAWSALLVALATFVGPTVGQETEVARRYAEAQEILLSRGYVAGYAAYLKVADDFPGTNYAADSLMTALQWAEPPEDLALMQRVVLEYAGTQWETPARLKIIAIQNRDHGRAEIAAQDQLAQSLGGPSLQRVLAGEGPSFSAAIGALPKQRQGDLYSIYHSIWITMAQHLGDYEEALPVALFLRETFTPLGVTNGTEVAMIRDSLRVEVTQSYEAENPVVTVSSPAENSVVSPQPTITAQITGGDINQLQVDLSKLEVLLDGQDVKSLVSFHSEIDRTPQPGEAFETISVTLTPAVPLATGPHSFSIVASTIQPSSQTPVGRTTFTRNFIVATTPPPDPTTETLNSTKDSILSAQNPHRNEGANPLLQLSHRPEERNKANNPIVAFDLSNVNVSAVTRATLVLDVQECDLPKKWGSEGRNILAYPVNESWVEGNGETLRVGQGEKTRGAGSGVTWFSPIDENIANKAPNGSVQWMGARPFLGPLTAPAVRVVNRQTGAISFDVTQDVQSGFDDGWLIRKQDESAFGNIRFYSKDRGAAKAPRLILEYGGQTGMTVPQQFYSAVAGFFGFTTPIFLQASEVSEGPKGLKELLRGSPRSAFAGEQVVLGFVGTHPLAQWGARIVYRSWLRDTPSLV